MERPVKISLTEKRKRFAREYAVDLNATQAAIRAGYARNCANRTAYTLMHDPGVAAEVHRNMQAVSVKIDVTANKVLKELARIAFADLAAIVKIDHGRVRMIDTDALTIDQRSAIARIAETENGVKIDMHDKTKALELLGRYLALFTDKLEHSGNVNVVERLSDEELERIVSGSSSGDVAAPTGANQPA
jgi:phage terminase small subunit